MRLTEIFRQAAQSRIITSAHRINQGSIPDLSKPEGDNDFYFVQADDPEAAVSRIIELVKTRIPQRFDLDPIRDIQVLCPMNRGGVGARSLNIELQAALNPAGERKVERFGWTFAPSDKVMQIENDYDKEVYNGDIGYIDDVDPDAGELTASFDGRVVTYGLGELDTLVPAYAATIHKSQGSEYPAVVIPVMTQHYTMLQRNLSIPASLAASGWSSWSGRRRPSPLPFATSPAGAAGQSCGNGCSRRCFTIRRRTSGGHDFMRSGSVSPPSARTSPHAGTLANGGRARPAHGRLEHGIKPRPLVTAFAAADPAILEHLHHAMPAAMSPCL